MKPLGILGGMGPYATIEFYKNVLDNTPAKKDWEHIHTEIQIATYIPSRTLAYKGEGKDCSMDIGHALYNMYERGCEVLAVPCNSAHYWYDTIRTLWKDIPWVNMIEVVSNHVKEAGFSKPLILSGYVPWHSKMYTKHFPDAVYPDPMFFQVVKNLIEDIKCGNFGDSHITGDRHLLIPSSVEKTHDCIISACTELAMCGIEGSVVFDSSEIYAKEIVKLCLQ